MKITLMLPYVTLIIGLVLMAQPFIEEAIPMVVAPPPVPTISFTVDKPTIEVPPGTTEKVTLKVKNNKNWDLFVHISDNSVIVKDPNYQIRSNIFGLPPITIRLPRMDEKTVDVLIAVWKEHNPEVFPEGKVSFLAVSEEMILTDPPTIIRENFFVTVNVKVVKPPEVPWWKKTPMNTLQILGLVLFLPSLTIIVHRRFLGIT